MATPNPYAALADVKAARAQANAAAAYHAARLARCDADSRPDSPGLARLAHMLQCDADTLARKARKLAGV